MVHFQDTALATLLRINADLPGCRDDHPSKMIVSTSDTAAFTPAAKSVATKNQIAQV
jgi:hypothetical protein